MRLIMRTVRYCALLLLVFLSPHQAVADPTITEREATLLILRTVIGNCGVRVPVGEYNFPVPSAAPGGEQHALVQTLIALKEINVVNWIDLQSMIGMAHFKIELRSDIDLSAFSAADANGARCILAHKERPTLKLIKTEIIKGGTTKWDGAIVYTTITSPRTDLFIKYWLARKWRLNETSKGRYLLRHDLFTQKWVLVAHDIALIDDPDFNSSNVPQALARD